MKVYISADIEGISYVTNWNETELSHAEHAQAAAQMTKEVLAACEGAIAAGAKEIYVKDAHDSARNILTDKIPEQVTLIRGWTNTPESMMAGIDSSFDAAIFIGYHSGAGFNGNPLSHTMNLENNYVKINGKSIAEFDMNAYVAAHYHVPVVFVSGDAQLCSHAKTLINSIETVSTKEGIGNATFNLSGNTVCRLIREGVFKGLSNRQDCLPETPEKFEMEINFKECVHALRSSYYPGASQIDSRTVTYTGKNILDMMTARMFML